MQFRILCLEGYDPNASAGGLASRITGLANILAEAGYKTHVWFVGDPYLPGNEVHDRLELHRWCQWVSQYHLGGVYDGEEGKRLYYVASLPPLLCQEILVPHLQQGKRAVILAEEWHTVDAVLHLDWLLHNAGVRHQVKILWNANNRVHLDLCYAVPPTKGGHRHGQFTVRRRPDPPRRGVGFDQSRHCRVSAVGPVL